jgi:hypothetical protein
MAWLQAVGADTDLGVPAPVAAHDGTLAVLAHAPGMPGPRGLRAPAPPRAVRAAGERLGVEQARAIARLQAGLRAHAAAWTRPDGFVRPRADTLTRRRRRPRSRPASSSPPPWARVEHPGARGRRPQPPARDRALRVREARCSRPPSPPRSSPSTRLGHAAAGADDRLAA